MLGRLCITNGNDVQDNGDSLFLSTIETSHGATGGEVVPHAGYAQNMPQTNLVFVANRRVFKRNFYF
jgi:hypothetical protein